MTSRQSGAPPSSASGSKRAGYVIGSSDRERQRLMQQGGILRVLQSAAFRSAALESGMLVRDIGSGAGDLAMLPAEFVGPTGAVVGLDRDATSVA